MSYIVKNPKTYKEFNTLTEAKKALEELDDYDIYETDFFGNLRKLSSQEVLEILSKEKIAQNIASTTSETSERISEKINNNEKIEPKIEDSSVEKPRALENPEKLKDDKKQESKNSKFMRTLLIIFMILILVFFLVFIIWPLFKDVYDLMANPPTIKI
ncbi:MAG: hypothetical protein QXU20_01730 [Candidatus Woesearchaeota archaeon]